MMLSVMFEDDLNGVRCWQGEVLALQQHLGSVELVERRLSMTSLSCGSPWWDRSHLYHNFSLEEQMDASRNQLEKAIGAPYDVKRYLKNCLCCKTSVAFHSEELYSRGPLF